MNSLEEDEEEDGADEDEYDEDDTVDFVLRVGDPLAFILL